MLKTFHLSFEWEVKRLQHHQHRSTCPKWTFSNTQRREILLPKRLNLAVLRKWAHAQKMQHTRTFAHWGQKHTASVKHCCPHSPDGTQQPALIQYQYSIYRWPLLPPALMGINGSRLVLTEWTPPRQRPAHTIITGSASDWGWILFKGGRPLSERLSNWLVVVDGFIFLIPQSDWVDEWGHGLLSGR